MSERRRRKRTEPRTWRCSPVAVCVLSRRDLGFHPEDWKSKNKNRNAKRKKGGMGREMAWCHGDSHPRLPEALSRMALPVAWS